VLELPGIRAVFALVAGPLVYLVRLWMAFFERRAYYYHWHIARAFYAAKATIRHRLRGGTRPVPPAVSG
jgi:uncharacterized membrane protein YiaA